MRIRVDVAQVYFSSINEFFIKSTRGFLKQTIRNIAMATVEFSLNNTESKFADIRWNQPPINFKRLIGLKTT